MNQTRLTFEHNFSPGELEVALREELKIKASVETDEYNFNKETWRIASSEDALEVLEWLRKKTGVINIKVEHPSP